MDLLRHGGMRRVFDEVRAPSTLGTFVRAFTFGHVRQLDSLAASLLVGLAQRTPLLPAADQIAFVDIDDTIRGTHGYTKQGAGYGYSKVKGLNALLATTQHPGRRAGDYRLPAAPRVDELGPRRRPDGRRRVGHRPHGAGAGRLVVLRADSAYYNYDVIAAAIRAGARFSVTARMDKAVRRTIAAIPEQAWTPIHYPNAVWDEDEERLISDAEVAEIELHHLHLQAQVRAHRRPADRAPRQTPQPGQRPGRPAGPVRHVPAPRGVH